MRLLYTSLVLLASDSSTATISRDLMLHSKSLNVYGSVFCARHKFARLVQECGVSVDSFTVKLLNQVQARKYEALIRAKVRDALLIQQLITGIEDETCREPPLNEDASSWEELGKRVLCCSS